MKGSWKRKVAMILGLIMILTSFDVQASANSSIDRQKDSPVIATGDLSVKGTNDVGGLVEKAIEENKKEQDKNNGNNIFSVEMREKTFVVDFETLQSCTMLLAIYSDDGKEMISSKTTSVEPGVSEVEIAIENVPEYFLIRAFLIDSETNHPLCTKYESPMYTKEMQDFLAKKTEDFEKDKVLNLDESETNNFAVYDENTQVIQETNEVNTLKEENTDGQRYVFDNIDTKISSLQEGDILSYEQEDDVLIIKIHTIDIDGDTAVITGEDTSMDEVFDYVKIDGAQDLGDAQIEKSDEEGVQYEGLKKDNSDITTRAVDFEESNSLEASVKFIDKKIGGEHVNAKLNGSVKLGMTTSVKVYVSLSYQYLEMKIDYKLSNEISLSGNVKGNIPLLKKVGFSPAPGVLIEFTPSFCVEGKASVSIKATVKASVGFSVSPQDGFKNLTSSPKYDNTEIDGSVNVFVGLSLEPKVVVISEAVAEAGVTAKAGGVIDATLEVYNSSPSGDEKHDCQNCIEGDISAKIVLGVDARFVSTLEVNYSKEYVFKITDFYYSLDSKTWGWGSCPNKQYKISVVVKNPNGKAVEGAIINSLYKTDQKGMTTIWLSNGVHTITAVKGDMESVSKKTAVSGKSKKVVVTFNTNTDIAGNEDSTSNSLIGKKVKSVSINRENCGIVTTEGDLYTWGYSDRKQLGTGLWKHKLPKKILSDVEEIQMLDCGPGAALTTKGDLYIWGGSNWLGGDSQNWHYGEKPVKILENVRSFKMDGFGSLVCYALTNDDELYLWGTYDMSDILEDYDENPRKVMDDVKNADIIQVDSTGWYEHNVCCAIKNNGDLYIWGGNRGGILGDLGMDEDEEEMLGSVTPIKRMENVKEAKLGQGYCVALTNSNDLYAWGKNSCGCIGNGTTDDEYEPWRVMSDIISYDVSEDSVAAINSKNQLFVWGDNERGILGLSKENDGYYEKKLTPTLLLDNIEKVNLSWMAGSARTISGGWYMWGEGAYVGETETCKPYKCPLKNVKMLNFYSSTIYAITKKNDLYFWGNSGFWNYEFEWNWSSESKYDPVKINGDLSSFKMTKPDDYHNEFDTYRLKNSNQKQYKLSDEIASVDPNSVYNIYVVEDDEKDWLGDNNLLYADQCTSDEEGNFDLEYVIGREIEGEPYVIVCKLDKINIEACSINVPDVDLCYLDNLDLIEINVLYKGKHLVEGTDYELFGNVKVEKPGVYALNIEGIGNYTGIVEKSFSVFCSHEYEDWIVTEGGKERTCVICGNVEKQETTATTQPSATVTQTPKPTSKPLSSNRHSSYSKRKTVKAPGKVNLKKVKALGKRKVRVNWKWSANQDGYQFQYAMNRSFTKKRKTQNKSAYSSSVTLKKLKKAKTYYFRVRAYRRSPYGGKKYGKWSNVKKIRVR